MARTKLEDLPRDQEADVEGYWAFSFSPTLGRSSTLGATASVIKASPIQTMGTNVQLTSFYNVRTKIGVAAG